MSEGRKRSGLSLWLWVIAAFALLIGAWSGLIYVASKNAPEAVPLEGEPSK